MLTQGMSRKCQLILGFETHRTFMDDARQWKRQDYQWNIYIELKSRRTSIFQSLFFLLFNHWMFGLKSRPSWRLSLWIWTSTLHIRGGTNKINNKYLKNLITTLKYCHETWFSIYNVQTFVQKFLICGNLNNIWWNCWGGWSTLLSVGWNKHFSVIMVI